MAAPKLSQDDRAELARLYRNAAAVHNDIAGLLRWTGRRNTADLAAAERADRLADRLDPDGF